MLSVCENDASPGADRLLSGVESGPVTDSQPRAARTRAEQASKVTKFFLKFLRDILSTSFETPSGETYYRNRGAAGRVGAVLGRATPMESDKTI